MSVLKEINKYRLKHDKNEHKLSESRQLQEQRQRVRSNKAIKESNKFSDRMSMLRQRRRERSSNVANEQGVVSNSKTAQAINSDTNSGKSSGT